MEFLFAVVLALVGPVLIELGIRRGHARWLEPWLREAWAILFCFLTVYVMLQDKTQAATAMLHGYWKTRPITGYAVFASIGAVIFGGYWWFTGRFSNPSEMGKRPPLHVAGKVPRGMTLHPSDGDIRLTFKSSPLYTERVQRRITRDLTSVRDYLIRLGIPVPIDLPPIGTLKKEGRDDMTTTYSYTPPGVPTYQWKLMLDETIVNDRVQITNLYCQYVMQVLLFGPESPFGDLPQTMENTGNWSEVTTIDEGLSTYLNFSFWNKVRQKRPFALTGFLPGALWDIREKLGRDFTDQMLGYTLKAMADGPRENMQENIGDYFMRKLKIGESVVDNDGRRWREIEDILHRHKFPLSKNK
jgi:hypothetical protein